MKKLNLGCGYEQPKDWVNVDKLDYGQHVIADVLHVLPFTDDTFDFIMMNHVLQMFHYDELPVVLKEVRRVLKPGGALRIVTPSLDWAIDAFIHADRDYFPIADELEDTLSGKFTRYLFWHGDTRCAFNRITLTDLLEKNGFDDVDDGVFGECELDSREKESLVMEATK